MLLSLLSMFITLELRRLYKDRVVSSVWLAGWLLADTERRAYIEPYHSYAADDASPISASCRLTDLFNLLCRRGSISPLR